MKKVMLISLLLLISAFTGFTQITEQEARDFYDKAEQQYEVQNFYECYQLCMDLKDKMGKHTPKTLYLMLKAVYYNLENSNEKGQKKIGKSYENYSRFYDYSTAFFSLVDGKTYPEQKLKEMEKIQAYFQQGMATYEYQKGRKPEDAIAFLNECATKFPSKYEDKWTRVISRSVRFSLEGHFLRVISDMKMGNYDLYYGKWDDSPTTWVEITFVDFSQVTSVVNETNSEAKCFGCPKWGFSGTNDKIKVTPIDGVEYKQLTTKGVVWSRRMGFKKSKRIISPLYEYLYSDTSATPDLAFATWETEEYKASTSRQRENGTANFYFLSTSYDSGKGSLFDRISLFDQASAAFQEGGYEQRIIEAFQFLVDYFPKKKATGNSENKTDIKSKF